MTPDYREALEIEGLRDGRDIPALIERGELELVTQVMERNPGESFEDFAKRVAVFALAQDKAFTFQNPDTPNQILVTYLQKIEQKTPPIGWRPSQSTISVIQGGL